MAMTMVMALEGDDDVGYNDYIGDNDDDGDDDHYDGDINLWIIFWRRRTRGLAKTTLHLTISTT